LDHASQHLFPDNTLQDEVADQPTIRRSNRSTKGQFSSKRYEDEFYLTTVNNNNHCSSQLEQLTHTASLLLCPTTGCVDTLDPRVFLAHHARTLKQDSNSPTLYEAMNGSQSLEYREAMKVEIDALERQNTLLRYICRYITLLTT
jgi:hypothetical protein